MDLSKKQSSNEGGKERCEVCGGLVPAHDIVHVANGGGAYRPTCTDCFNTEVAKAGGIDRFENVRLQPIVLEGGDGKPHEFHFRRRLFGDRVSLEAFEIDNDVPSGYRFELLGDPEEEVLALLSRLVPRMRRGLAERHLADDEFGLHIAADVVRGRIESDLNADGEVPALVIDGREISWEAFGRMMMAFEGWQFRLQIVDSSDEA